MAGAEIAERRPLDVTAAPPKVQELIHRLDLTADMDTMSAQLDIMDAILSATTEEEVFAKAEAGAISGQDYVGRPFLVQEWTVKRSAPGFIQEGGFPFYYLLRAQDANDGKAVVLTCGGFTFVSVMDALDRLGALEKGRSRGGYGMVLESRTMKGSGFDVLIPHPYNPPAAKTK